MALLEAMSWGLPAIATPVGGIPEVILPSQNGLLVEPGNIKITVALLPSFTVWPWEQRSQEEINKNVL